MSELTLKYNTKQLNLSALASGMYYVYLLSEHKTISVEKIIIQ
ncbi:MAG: T9SS type A sorting domain-containing protein [Sphingobacteriales bacterium]|nr:T9SS type A sorting domain-containing protein [Sphingobacteriales bacterium]MBP9142705.1 T9SS type A sorting domain-containing protein [Chitinophagales bacterium]MBK6889767.1 T9SS type A sorting domain-containing protein [Sphingobacteriales bacterium]MBK7527717.1 T9SS type A sorting domain-containing protein [Sphingobacteriales bacterium]MBK8678705.1 T9SS type A sorting domain-containing protein [Sphingobacteriales bacterium]